MLRKLAPAFLVALLTLTAAAPADAFFMTCGDARALGEAEDSVIGHSLGTLDTLAGLLCFVGDAKCDCLIDAAANRPREFSREFSRALADCDDSSPAFGAAVQASVAMCGS